MFGVQLKTETSFIGFIATKSSFTSSLPGLMFYVQLKMETTFINFIATKSRFTSSLQGFEVLCAIKNGNYIYRSFINGVKA